MVQKLKFKALKYICLPIIKVKHDLNGRQYLAHYFTVWLSFSIFFNRLSIEKR